MGEDESNESNESNHVPEAYRYCKVFRVLAKRARSLDHENDDAATLSEDKERTSLIEDIWDIGAELDVWVNSIAESLVLSLICLYQGGEQDEKAVEVLNHLADQELRNLQSSDQGKVEEEEDEGEG